MRLAHPTCLILAAVVALPAHATPPPLPNRVTILYDAFDEDNAVASPELIQGKGELLDHDVIEIRVCFPVLVDVSVRADRDPAGSSGEGLAQERLPGGRMTLNCDERAGTVEARFDCCQ